MDTSGKNLRPQPWIHGHVHSEPALPAPDQGPGSKSIRAESKETNQMFDITDPRKGLDLEPAWEFSSHWDCQKLISPA